MALVSLSMSADSDKRFGRGTERCVFLDVMELIVFIADAAAAVYFLLLLDGDDDDDVDDPHLVLNIVCAVVCSFRR